MRGAFRQAGDQDGRPDQGATRLVFREGEVELGPDSEQVSEQGPHVEETLHPDGIFVWGKAKGSREEGNEPHETELRDGHVQLGNYGGNRIGPLEEEFRCAVLGRGIVVVIAVLLGKLLCKQWPPKRGDMGAMYF